MGVFRNFPYSNFHEMNMDEIIKIVKTMLEEWSQYYAEWDTWMTQINDDWTNYQEVMNEAWQNMQNFINNYFDNLDVQEEINNKIVSMIQTGEFGQLVNEYIPPAVSAWLALHITEPTGVVIDTSLSVSGACADAKATGDAIANAVTNLTNQIDEIRTVDSSANLFNKNDPGIVNGKYYLYGGTVDQYNVSYVLIPIKTAGTYKMRTIDGIVGENNARYVSIFDASKTYLSPIGGNITDHILTVDIPSNMVGGYFAYNFSTNGINTVMVVCDIEYPSTYIPYYVNYVLTDEVRVQNINLPTIEKDDTDFVKVAPTNLIDLSAMSVGVIDNYNGSLDTSASNWYSTDYIPVDPDTDYILRIANGSFYGNTYLGIAYYDSDKNYVGHIVPDGGLQSISVIDTIHTPNDGFIAYIRTSFQKTNVENPYYWYLVMMIKGTTYPRAYMHFDGDYRLIDAGLSSEFSKPLNCLFGKIAIWNGDSICAADNDPQGGWVQRIGKDNGMWARNYAVSGGCIAENVGSAHSVSGTLDTMLSDFPNADYILIDGGTNDADLLGDSGIGTFDADDFSAEYITALDKDTFSGALESIFYRLVTVMKGKHIGYIIPQKMGHTEALVTRRRTYFDRAIAICQKWGVPYIDLWNNFYFNWRLSAHWDSSMTSAQNETAGNLYQDGQHLTTTGYATLSPIIAEWMKTI